MVCESASKAPGAALVLMAAAAAALAAADPPPAMSQAAGAGGTTARRDFYWLRSFLAGGGCSRTGASCAGLAGAESLEGRVHVAAMTFLDSGCFSALPHVYPDLL